MFTMQEIQALLEIAARTPMSFAERLWVQGIAQRLAQFRNPPPPAPKPEPKPQEPEGDALRDTVTVPNDAQAMADDLKVASALTDALDAADKEP